MNLWSYEVRSEISIRAAVDHVFSIAADPRMVPRFVPEVSRIERLQELGNQRELVRVWIRIAGFEISSVYRYAYRPPRSKSGAQVGGSWLKGFFTLSFEEHGGVTKVVHIEGIRSPAPGLALLAGIIYFRLLAPGGAEDELLRLKELAEGSRESAADRAG